MKSNQSKYADERIATKEGLQFLRDVVAGLSDDEINRNLRDSILAAIDELGRRRDEINNPS